jgi:protein-S-isoprenylcysteine O-methyltransferase Ste14
LIHLTILALYTTIIISLVWARFNVFYTPKHLTTISVLYDSIVSVQILVTYYSLVMGALDPIIPIAFCIGLYTCSLYLFWWSVFTARNLDFAFSNEVSRIIRTGPYYFIRHPFYLSYTLSWISSSLLFNSIGLWITLGLLVIFYFLSARKEEKVFNDSMYSIQYAEYIRSTGMFLPRVTQWKNWLLKLLPTKYQ